MTTLTVSRTISVRFSTTRIQWHRIIFDAPVLFFSRSQLHEAALAFLRNRGYAAKEILFSRSILRDIFKWAMDEPGSASGSRRLWQLPHRQTTAHRAGLMTGGWDVWYTDAPGVVAMR